jgi:Phosphodiester glycosidase
VINRFWITAALAVTSLTGGYAIAACTAVSPATGAAQAPGMIRTSPAARVVALPSPKRVPPKVSIERTYSPDRSLVTVATFSGPLRYVLYDGSQDPYIPYGEVRDQSAVTGANRSRLLAAFNGGFKMVADAGGYEQAGHVVSPLRYGFASLVISRDGQARIEVWKTGDQPEPYSVRQNLQALVLGGKPTAAAYDWGLWGATLGGGEYVARSAIGQNAAGDIMYAGSMSATPYDLARALSRYGARTGMELDINPAWVQLDVAHEPGGQLHAKVAGQYRPADQYLDGWTRDFIAVLGP